MFTDKNRLELEQNGYTVVRDVVPALLQARARAEIVQHIRMWCPSFMPCYSERWDVSELPPGTLYGINRTQAHLQSHWDIRQHPPVAEVFAKAYGPEHKAEQMLVSMDAWNYMCAKKNIPQRSWVHTDQGPNYSGLMIQGVVVLEDCDGPHDGGLVVWNKGHLAHSAYFKRYDVHDHSGKNFFRIKHEFIQEIERIGIQLPDGRETGPMKRVKVPAKAGDLILWDSRTPHENQYPTPGGRDRYAMYVCMAPRALVTPHDIMLRQSAWEQKMMTSHWPVQHVSIFSMPVFQDANKRALYKSLREITDRPLLTDLGRRLLGEDLFQKKRPADDTENSSSVSKGPMDQYLVFAKKKKL